MASMTAQAEQDVQPMGWIEAVRLFIRNTGEERKKYRGVLASLLVGLRAVGVFGPAVTFFDNALLAVPIIGPIALADDLTRIVLLPFGIFCCYRIWRIRHDYNQYLAQF